MGTYTYYSDINSGSLDIKWFWVQFIEFNSGVTLNNLMYYFYYIFTTTVFIIIENNNSILKVLTVSFFLLSFCSLSFSLWFFYLFFLSQLKPRIFRLLICEWHLARDGWDRFYGKINYDIWVGLLSALTFYAPKVISHDSPCLNSDI